MGRMPERASPARGSFVYPSKDFGGETTSPWNTYGPFKGLLDEVSIYNRMLTLAEITAIYSAGSSGKCPPSAPFIATQPANQTVTAGSNVNFTVIAGGTSPLSYQWKFNGTNLTLATNLTLSLTNLQLNQAGNYSVLITNAYGSATSSNALLIVNAAPSLANPADKSRRDRRQHSGFCCQRDGFHAVELSMDV